MFKRTNIKNAINWSLVDVLLRNATNFLALILLARVLAPADFGHMAMLAFFMSLSGILIDGGLGQALIQRRSISYVDESTAFYATVVVAALLSVALCAILPLISSYYDSAILEDIGYFLAFNLFLSSFSAIQIALLTRKLNFKIIAIANVVATLIATFSAVFLARMGYGIWSLVTQALLNTTISVVILWYMHPWRPGKKFSFASLCSMFSFSGFILWTRLLRALHTNLYALLIGKMYSIQDVGFYSQANRIQQLPVQIVTNIVGRISFPIFSSLAEKKQELYDSLRSSLSVVVFINTPVMLILMILAEPIIYVLIGERWGQVIPLLKVLAVLGLLWPLHALNINALLAQGYSSLNAKIQLIKLSISIVFLLILSPYGILYIVYGQVAASLISLFINTHYTRVHIGYGLVKQLQDIVQYGFPSLTMCMLMYWAGSMFEYSFVMLLSSVILGLLGYVIICVVLKVDGVVLMQSYLRNKSLSEKNA